MPSSRGLSGPFMANVYGYRDDSGELSPPMDHHPGTNPGYYYFKKCFDYHLLQCKNHSSNEKAHYFNKGSESPNYPYSGGVRVAIHCPYTYVTIPTGVWELINENDYFVQKHHVIDYLAGKPQHPVLLDHTACRILAARIVNILDNDASSPSYYFNRVFLETWGPHYRGAWDSGDKLSRNETLRYLDNYKYYTPILIKYLRAFRPGIVIDGQFAHYIGVNEKIEFIRDNNINMLYYQRVDGSQPPYPYYEAGKDEARTLCRELRDRELAIEWYADTPGNTQQISDIINHLKYHFGPMHRIRIRFRQRGDTPDYGYLGSIAQEFVQM